MAPDGSSIRSRLAGLTVGLVALPVALLAGHLPAAAAPAPAANTSPASPQSGRAVALGPSNGAPALLTTTPNVAKGTGPVHNGTFLTFDLADRVRADVNVGSGNLLVRRSDLSLPGVDDNVTLGAAYNSLLVGSAMPGGTVGVGWRTRTGTDVRLVAGDDGSVTYAAPDGVIGTFTANGSGYNAPKEFKATLARDGSGWKLTEHESGRKLYFTAAGLLDRWNDRNDNVTDLVHDASSKVTKIVSTRGTTNNRTANVSYNPAGRISQYQRTGDDGVNHTVAYAYDSAGRLASITDAENLTTRFEYDSAGNLTAIVTPGNSRTTVTYDTQRRVTSLTRVTDLGTGRGATTRLAYTTATETKVADANTDLSQAVTAVPNTTYTLDADEHVTKVVDPAGNTRSTTYTPYYDVAGSVNAEGGATSNTYGANSGQSLTRSASATGAATSLAYANPNTATNPTAAWQPSSSTDTQGNGSTYTYNGAGNRTSGKDALAAEAKVDYNTDGTVKSATDPGNGTNSTTYSYDANKQLTTLTPPTGNSLRARRFTYDAYGRLRTSDDGAGRISTYTYDKNGRTTTIAYSDGTTSVNYTYDGNGNVTTRLDAAGTTTYSYDTLNRLTSRTATSGGGTLGYAYDPVGNMTRLTDGRGSSTYTYDTRNLLTGLTTAGGTPYAFGYDKDGRRTTTWFKPNADKSTWAARTTVTYDKSGRITRTTTARASSAANVVYDASLCYSKYVAGQGCNTAAASDTGLRQWRTDHTTGAISVYTYDQGNRLTAATNIDWCNYRIAYDVRGNRTRWDTRGGTGWNYPYSYNSANQLTKASNDPSAVFAYDAAGNMTNSDGKIMAYNAAGQMQTLRQPSASVDTRYTYAGPDQNELVAVGGDRQTFTYGRQNQHGIPQAQSTTDKYNGTYYFELDSTGTPVGFRTANVDYVYAVDEIGSVIAAVDANGVEAARFKYGLAGDIYSESGNGSPATGSSIGYAGGLFIADFNLGTSAADAGPAASTNTECSPIRGSTDGRTKFGRRYLPVEGPTAGGAFSKRTHCHSSATPPTATATPTPPAIPSTTSTRPGYSLGPS